MMPRSVNEIYKSVVDSLSKRMGSYPGIAVDAIEKTCEIYAEEYAEQQMMELLDWMAKNHYREVGISDITGAMYAKFQGKECCSDYYTTSELYTLYLKQQEGK